MTSRQKLTPRFPFPARIWNYWLGGKDYYPVDKEAGDAYARVFPGIFTYAGPAGIFIGRLSVPAQARREYRRFLDVGTGLPSHDNTHEIAQRASPGARVVYVDNSPLVLAHARALLTSGTPGRPAGRSGDRRPRPAS